MHLVDTGPKWLKKKKKPEVLFNNELKVLCTVKGINHLDMVL